MTRRNHDIITIDTVKLKHETKLAYLFQTANTDHAGAFIDVWIPKSQCDFLDGELQLPEWLAEEKGLI